MIRCQTCKKTIGNLYVPYWNAIKKLYERKDLSNDEMEKEKMKIVRNLGLGPEDYHCVVNLITTVDTSTVIKKTI